MSIRLTCCLVLAVVWFGTTEVTAQRGTTSTGVFGSRTVGSGQGFTAGTRNTFGGTGNFGTGIGGAQDGALGGTTAGSRIEQLIGGGQGGGVDGSERYVRGNRQAGQFVGSDTAEAAFVGAMSGGGGGLAGGNFGAGLGQRNNRQRDTNNLNRDNSQRSVNIRTQLSIGFRYSKLPETAVQAKTRKVLNSGAIAKLGSIEVDVIDRTARLRGVVASEADRELAVQLARLEPGISSVEDELVVDASEPDATSPSDPR